MGGPILAAALTCLCLIGLHEYNQMSVRVGNKNIAVGYAALPFFAFAPLLDADETALLAVCAAAIGAPLVWAIFRRDHERAFIDWVLAATGTLYLGIPLFAAISLRQMNGTIDADWLVRLSNWLSFGWGAHPRGLAWLLTVILITWLGDTGAYLVGRSFGRRPLIPHISPKKTVEGLMGGLASAALTGVVSIWAFGLGINLGIALLLGALIGATGVIGDLAESLLKRQTGVKDSGTLIPGHGGMLDRLDALLFTWTVGWFVATLADRWF